MIRRLLLEASPLLRWKCWRCFRGAQQWCDRTPMSLTLTLWEGCGKLVNLWVQPPTSTRACTHTHNGRRWCQWVAIIRVLQTLWFTLSEPPRPHFEVQGFPHRRHHLPERQSNAERNGPSKARSHGVTGKRKKSSNISGWWLAHPSEKYESQLG